MFSKTFQMNGCNKCFRPFGENVTPIIAGCGCLIFCKGACFDQFMNECKTQNIPPKCPWCHRRLSIEGLPKWDSGRTTRNHREIVGVFTLTPYGNKCDECVELGQAIKLLESEVYFFM